MCSVHRAGLCVWLASAGLLFTSCTTTSLVEPHDLDGPAEVSLSLADGLVLDLSDAVVRADSIGGVAHDWHMDAWEELADEGRLAAVRTETHVRWLGSPKVRLEVRLPLDEVLELRSTSVSSGKTAGLVIGAAVTGVLVAGIVYANQWNAAQ